MKKSLLRQIIKRCQEELPNHPQLENFPHWCFIVKDNKIVSDGVNNFGIPHPKWGYHGRHASETYEPKTHAELHAISRSRHIVVGCVAINVRLNRNSQIRMSAPCLTCQRLLKAFGIKKCVFTHEAGWGEMTF